MLPLAAETADNIAATAQATLEMFADLLVIAKTSRSDFRISDLGCGKYPMSLYLQVPPSDRDRIMPLFRMIIMQFSKVLSGMWWKVP
jgi:type IV secretion system protein VirD4